MAMPKLPAAEMLSKVPAEYREIFAAAFNLRTDTLRASKPFRRAENLAQASSNYVWRMLCFTFCGSAPHCCLPVMADFDLLSVLRREWRDMANPYGYQEQAREQTRKLDEISKAAESIVPAQYKRGLLRWANVL
jgi:hypothetical protein